jgi:uncharacterized protein
MNMDESPRQFSNHPIDPGAIPDFRTVELEPVASSFLPYAVLTQVVFWLLLLVAAVGVRFVPYMPFQPGWWVAIVPAVAGVWFGAVAWFDARRRGWALREHDLIYRYGIIWRKVVIVPFTRIQHVETSSGPVERWFGLMRVKCFTAGGMTADLSVVGLDVVNARKVRQHLLEQIRADGTNPEAVDADDDEPSEPDWTNEVSIEVETDAGTDRGASTDGRI